MTIFALALKEHGMKEWERSGIRVSATRSEAMGGCQLGSWSSLLYIMALARVIRRPIHTIYPKCAEAIRRLLHGVVNPCSDMPSKVDFLYVLCSKDDGSNTRPYSV